MRRWWAACGWAGVFASTAIAAALAAMDVRSRWREDGCILDRDCAVRGADRLGDRDHGWMLRVDSYRGRVLFWLDRYDKGWGPDCGNAILAGFPRPTDSDVRGEWDFSCSHGDPYFGEGAGSFIHRLGFRLVRQRNAYGTERCDALWLPYWCPTGLFSIPPALRLRTARRRRRRLQRRGFAVLNSPRRGHGGESR
jgi:hypothetical protein